MAESEAATQSPQLSVVWKSVSSELAAEIEAFWTANSAMPSAQARGRAAQVVVVARDAAGAICAVSTAVAMMIPKLRLPCFYFRQFIAPKQRSQYLARELLAESTRALGTDPGVGTPDGPRGVLLEVHNPKLARTIRDVIWRVREFEFVYIGPSKTGHVMRVCYFPGGRYPVPQRRAAGAGESLTLQ